MVRDVNFDFSEYAVAIADLMLGRMIAEKTIHSTTNCTELGRAVSNWSIRDE